MRSREVLRLQFHLVKSVGARWSAMLDTVNQMAELKFEAPLAQFEETEDEWQVQGMNISTNDVVDNFKNLINSSPLRKNINDNIANNLKNSKSDIFISKNREVDNMEVGFDKIHNCGKEELLKNLDQGNLMSDNFTETFSGSLEDLVNTFDDRITKCFCDYEENIEKLAPVQVRSQEEIMNECQ